MKILHINIDEQTHRAALNLAALLGTKADDLLSTIVTKLTTALDKDDNNAAQDLHNLAATISSPQLKHSRVKLALPWQAWQTLTDYSQYHEEKPAHLAALLAAALPAAMLDALRLTSPEYQRQQINLPAILNKLP